MRVRRRDARIAVELEPQERALLRSLAHVVRDLLAPEPAGRPGDPLDTLVGPMAGPADPPDDPALARLLPDAYADVTAAREFRGLTEAALRAEKVAALDRMLAALDAPAEPIVLDPEAAGAWVAALNDVRLVLGVRLGVTEDVWDEVDALPADDPRLPAFSLYELSTHLQERLVTALL